MPKNKNNILYDRRIERINPLISPQDMLEKFSIPSATQETVLNGRNEIEAILEGNDSRFLLIVGPCSIHDPIAALDYARRLCCLRKRYSSIFCIVMRVYFEKPRTSLGWRGLIVEPDLDGIINIAGGLEKARKMLIDITALGLPAATELLDPIIPQYTADLVSWASIGARSAESQIHRELASGLSMPVGFKNPTDGDISTAINAIISAREPHAFLGVTQTGLSAIMHTSGNEHAHLVLRGSTHKPNYDRASIRYSSGELRERGIDPAVLIDCSHGNSQKNPNKQYDILLEALRLRFDRYDPVSEIRGCMLESFIQAGSVDIRSHAKSSAYGQSITDPCISWSMTEQLLAEAAALTRRLRRKNSKVSKYQLSKEKDKVLMQSIEIYTDGACSKNPGPGGWAFVMLLKEDGEYQSGSELERGAGGEKETTNNRMELQAVIRALQQYAHNRAIDPEFPQTVSIHTDSQYVQQGISSWIKNWKKNGWKTSGKEPVKNKDLWLALDTLAEQYKPQWVWVKGHAGNFYNELCDTLAVAEVKKL